MYIYESYCNEIEFLQIKYSLLNEFGQMYFVIYVFRLVGWAGNYHNEEDSLDACSDQK